MNIHFENDLKDPKRGQKREKALERQRLTIGEFHKPHKLTQVKQEPFMNILQ